MRTLTDQLAQYATYHRHPRNIASHFIGIPLIMLALSVLLSRPALHAGVVLLTPALVGTAAALVFYFMLDIGFGIIMAVLMGLGLWFGAWCAAQPAAVWLSIGIGGFVLGWILQFIGHYYEGRKPAFVDDVIGLLIGPLFVVAEAMFLLGMRRDLQAEIEARAGALRSW
jgi:uncharacterized membrane protein YGL010W